MKRTAHGAFTLIELLLVLVILAVLASVVVPVYTKQLDKAHYNGTIADISQIKTSLAHFQLDNGRFPTTDEGLGALVSQPSGLNSTWNGPYIEQVPPDKWGTPYFYICQSPDDPSNYKLFSCGRDLVPNTADDITQYTLSTGSAPQ